MPEKPRRIRRSRKKPTDWKDCLILFGAGAVWDAILTADVVVTAQLKIPWAMATTAAITIISFSVYDRVIGRAGVDKRRLAILAAGSAFGAGITTWLFAS